MFFRRDDDSNLDVKTYAISQIFILILASFSFAFLIAESSQVSAQAPGISPPIQAGSVTGSGVFNSQVTVRGITFQPGPYTYSVKEGNLILARGGTSVQTSVQEVNTAIAEANSKIPAASQGSAVPGTPGADTGIFGGNPFGASEYVGTTGGYLLSGVIWGGAAAAIVYFVGDFLGLDDNQKEAASIALGAGVGIARFGFLQAGGGVGSAATTGFGGVLESVGFYSYPALWAIGIAAVVYIAIYREETQKVINFQCLPYEAPVGGRNCEECNGDPMRPCSEYRCRALGQACELVNAGTSDEKCVWVNPNDATSPTITPSEDALTENHRYTNHETRPTSLGTKIVYNNNANGCLQAFTPLSFGITTNEPAQCKIDIDHKDTFDEMQFFFGGTNLFLYNHTQTFSLPSPEALNAEAPELLTDGKYDFFVRCRDKNGNENVDEYAIQLCVDPSPDTTAPVIVDTSIPSDSYVKFGAQSVPVSFYVNEPATCKWSTQDKEYSVMENTMNCATTLKQVNARELYTCQTNFTGIVDRQTNNYFIRCKDQPSKPEEDRNVNVVSYKYNLKGSQPLNIIFTSPNGTVTGNSNTVPVELKVTTDDGANEGVSICSFSSSGLPDSYVLMFETDAVEHTQRLDLPTGNYNYHFRCVDYGGNTAEAETGFTVIVDTFAPLVTRAYRDSSQDALKIVTNEDAECAYSLNSCNFNFDEGIEMLYLSASNKKSHYSEWKPNVAYYIKCRDVFNNEPGPNTCSLVASATNIR